MGIGSLVVQNYCLGCDFQLCTMLHWRETSTFVFSSSTLGEKRLHSGVGGEATKISGRQLFFKNCFFWKSWPSKNGYRQLCRQNSLRWISFSGLYDASPARHINFCVFHLDLGQKKIHFGKGTFNSGGVPSIRSF